MRVSDFARVRLGPLEPLKGLAVPFFPGPAPKLTVLAPNQSPDGRWHLFYAVRGALEHGASRDGFTFEPVPSGVNAGIEAPDLLVDQEGYMLVYASRGRSSSAQPTALMARRSRDLLSWTSERPLLLSTLGWHGRGSGRGVSDPCLIQAREGGYHLYYGADLLPRGRFGPTARCLGVAHATEPFGPFVPQPAPLVAPGSRGLGTEELAVGPQRLMPLDDGLVAVGFPLRSHGGEPPRAELAALVAGAAGFTPLRPPLVASWSASWSPGGLSIRPFGGKLRVFLSMQKLRWGSFGHAFFRADLV